MIYYRLAFQDRQTTALTSLQAVFQLLRTFSALPQDSIRVFAASSTEDLDEMLTHENNGLASSSVTATQFLPKRNIAISERAQSVSEQSVSAQAAQPGASVATWAKDLWERHTTMGPAQASQQAATVAVSSPLRESITTTDAPASLGMSLLEQKRLELERGQGGDHDTPYLFTLPISMKERLAWMRLQTRVQTGELPS